MTNRKKYAKEILDIACKGYSIAVHKDTLKPVICVGDDCCECAFNHTARNCLDDIEEWCNAEYKEPEVDWSKVAVDTPIWVSSDGINWYKRHFAKHTSSGSVYAWDSGGTSWSMHEWDVTLWNYAKLAQKVRNER